MQPQYPPPGYVPPAPAPAPKRSVLALSITALVLAVAITVLLSLNGYPALGVAASLVPFVLGIVAVCLEQRNRALAIIALLASFIPLLVYVAS